MMAIFTTIVQGARAISMCPQPGSHVPEETARVARAAFPKGNPYLTLRNELETIYAESFFEDLFPKRGQPAESPGRLTLVAVLQFAENLSDRQAADAVRSRIDWKYLLELDLRDPGFDFSVLSEFRNRLLAGGLAQSLLDDLLERFRERGLLKERGKQRTDSTHIQAAARNLNRLECVGETIRQALNSLADIAPQWVQDRVPQEWYARYGSRFEQYRLPKTDSARQSLTLQIGQDGRQLLHWVYAAERAAELRQHPAVETMRRVWVQQYYVQDDEVRWRHTDNMPSTEHVIHSPYNPEDRWSQKRETEWFGYKAHITETCNTDRPHLITHIETTTATTQDEQVTEPIHRVLAQKHIVPAEHLLDRGYVTTQVLIESENTHGIAVIGPMKVDTTWQAQVGKGFDVSCFTIDWEHQHVTCPGGQVSQVWADSRDNAGHPRLYVRFAKFSYKS
jgi:transposase